MNVNRLIPVAGIEEEPIWSRSEDGRHGSNLSGRGVIEQFTNRYISLPTKLDEHVAVRIDARRLERMDHDGRVRHLDDRRPHHDVAGNEALAPEDRRVVEIAQLRPVDRPRAGVCVARWR